MSWDERFIGLARHIAGWSKDRSRGVGCVIVGPKNDVRALGFNGFPRGCDDGNEYRHTRPAKYLWTEHAERNAVYNAASTGTPLAGCRAYVTLYPCADCARALVQSGIVEVIAPEPDWAEAVWSASFAVSRAMFAECGVMVRFVESRNDDDQ